jgi:hypothetical protein
MGFFEVWQPLMVAEGLRFVAAPCRPASGSRSKCVLVLEYGGNIMQALRVRYWVNLYTRVCVATLFVSIGAKLLSMEQGGKLVLSLSTPFGLHLRTFMVVALMFETVLATVLLCDFPVCTKLLLTLSIGLSFLAYRVATAFFSPPLPCGCLGLFEGLSSRLQMTLNILSYASLAILLMSALLLLTLPIAECPYE